MAVMRFDGLRPMSAFPLIILNPARAAWLADLDNTRTESGLPPPPHFCLDVWLRKSPKIRPISTRFGTDLPKNFPIPILPPIKLHSLAPCFRISWEQDENKAGTPLFKSTFLFPGLFTSRHPLRVHFLCLSYLRLPRGRIQGPPNATQGP